MPYELRLDVLVQYREQFLNGIVTTIWLSVVSIAAGTLIGVVLASQRSVRPGPVRWVVGRLCGGDPQHTVPGAALHHLFRPAGARPARRRAHRGPDRHDHQSRGLFDRDHPRRHRIHPQVADRGGRGARPHPDPDLPRHRHPAGDRQGLSGALQPVRADDAGLQRVLGHLDAGTDRRCLVRPVAELPLLRGLYRGRHHYLALALALRDLLALVGWRLFGRRGRRKPSISSPGATAEAA